MKIASLQKQSLIEYPGKISAIIFLAGCNFRCPWCFTGNNFVLTDRGRLKIKDIVEKRINCRIYDSERNFSSINKYFQRKTNQLLQIKTFWRSEIIECTPNHKFLVYNSKEGKFLEKEAKNLDKNYDFLTISIPKKEIFDYKLDINPAITTLYQTLKTKPRLDDKKLFNQVIRLREKGYSWRQIYKILNVTDWIRIVMTRKDYLDSKILPIIKTKKEKVAIKGGKFYINRFLKVTPEFMRLIGYYLAEGCVSKEKDRKNSYYLSFTFNLKEKEFVEDVKNIFFRIFQTKLKEITKKESKSIELLCYKSILGLFFKYYFGSNSLDKKLPSDFLFLKKELQRELIKGLFLGDGVTSEKFLRRYQWQRLSCCSDTLKYQISLILYRLGIKHSLQKKEISIKDEKIFELLGQNNLITKKTINIGKRYGFLDDKYVYLRIDWIKKIKKFAKVYNLEINNQSHTYNVSLVNVSNCYVPSLVLPEKIKKIKGISKKEIFSFLKERKKFLEAVVITGGEPTINKELPDFIKKIKTLNYLVGLETNGSNFRMLRYLISKKLIDYVGMDIKQDLVFKKYNEVVGGILKPKIFENIKKSIDLLLNSKIDYDFRTTLMKEFHKKEDVISICKKIKKAKNYYLQNFEERGETVSSKKFTPFSKKELLKIIKEGKKYTNIKLRPWI